MQRDNALMSDYNYNCIDDNTDSFGFNDQPDNFKIKLPKFKKLIKMVNPITGVATLAAGGALSKKILRKPIIAGAAGSAGKVVKMIKKADSQSPVNQTMDKILKPDDTAQQGDGSGLTTMPAYTANTQSMSPGSPSNTGGGDIGGDPVYSADSEESILSTAENPKDLENVTVNSSKPNWLFVAIAAVIVVIFVIYLVKTSKKK